MAQHYSQLCALLVQDAYGELSSQVFTTLSLWGRLNLSTLVQHSELSPRHTRYGLTVLIQQHLVMHSAPDSDEQCFYEVDWPGAYNLLRTGKIVKIVEDRFGEAAGTVISNLLQLGHARVGDLEDAYKFTSKNSGAIDSAAEHINGEGLPNGVVKGHLATKGQVKKVASSAQLHSVLYKLLQSGFVTRVTKRTYLSSADASNEAETLVKREQFPDGKVSGPKAKVQFTLALNTLKRKWRDEADDITLGVTRNASRGMNGHGPAAKRQRMNGGTVNGVGHYGGDDDDEDSGVTLEKDMVIKVNYEKCNVALRSQALERQVARSIGETAAKVYSALLVLLERKVARCYDNLEEYFDPGDEEAAQPSSTTLEIADILDPSMDLSSTIATGDDDFYDDEAPVKKEKTVDKELVSMASRNKHLDLVGQHMAIVAEHPHGFATKVSTRGKGEWRVNFPALVRWLQRNEVESVINTRFGSVSTRIVRMLSVKGKLDEKQVATFSFLRQKDIRSILTEMQEAGFVEAQEVPKDNSRQPSRALYLWYFDPERCKQQLLSNTYKAQARLIQRMQFEQDEVQHSVRKAERLDVVGHEDEILTQQDKQNLRQWREYEEKLLTQLSRQDDLVALMRDFLPETAAS